MAKKDNTAIKPTPFISSIARPMFARGQYYGEPEKLVELAEQAKRYADPAVLATFQQAVDDSRKLIEEVKHYQNVVDSFPAYVLWYEYKEAQSMLIDKKAEFNRVKSDLVTFILAVFETESEFKHAMSRVELRELPLTFELRPILDTMEDDEAYF